MTSLADYQTKYKTIVLRREDGILEMRFHTEGGPLRWGFLPHEEAEDAFLHIGRDRENKAVIMTGTGAEFSGPAPDPEANRQAHHMGPREWAELGWLNSSLSVSAQQPIDLGRPASSHSALPVVCSARLTGLAKPGRLLRRIPGAILECRREG